MHVFDHEALENTYIVVVHAVPLAARILDIRIVVTGMTPATHMHQRAIQVVRLCGFASVLAHKR